ncbi:uroporphyrinogen-III synthase [Novosphingobium lubricantis]
MTALPLIVIRPEPGNAATLAAARAAGITAIAAPLFAIAPVDWTVPEAAFDAILVGSANVFRHGGPGLAALRTLPVIAVGEATAAAARAAGFAVAQTGEGGLQPVVETLPPGHYLRLAGQDRVTLSPPGAVRIATQVVYAAQPRQSARIWPRGCIRGSGCALLGAAAQHFAKECQRLGISPHALHLACLAPRIAELAGAGWAETRIAAAVD